VPEPPPTFPSIRRPAGTSPVHSPPSKPAIMPFAFPRYFATFACMSLLGAGSGCVREHTLFEDAGRGGAGGTGGVAGNTGGVAGNTGGVAGNTGGVAGNTGGVAGGTSAGGRDEKGGADGGGGSDGGSPANAGGDSAGTGASGPPWQKSTCEAALSAGKTGDPCVSVFQCSATADCCQIIALCKGGALLKQGACDLCATSCSADSDCTVGQLCENYQCAACRKESCPSTWISLARNGCSVCVPPNVCKSDQDCPDGTTCNAGLSCMPGCKADPSCCFGNQCASVACGALTALDCLVVGCSPGSSCKGGGEPPQCKCDTQAGQWVCSAPSKSVCVTP